MVDPEFKSRISQRSGPVKEPVTFRMSPDWKSTLESIAAAEGDNGIAGLILEGVVRVVDARKNDPEYMDKLQAAQAERVAALQSELEKLQSGPTLDL